MDTQLTDKEVRRSLEVYVGFCQHNQPRAAIVANYATPKDVAEMRRNYRVELIDGPVTMGGDCEECVAAELEAKSE